MFLIQSLVGLKVLEVQLIHDYLHLKFSNKAILNIYNNFEYVSKKFLNIIFLENQTVYSIDETEEVIEISFSMG